MSQQPTQPPPETPNPQTSNSLIKTQIIKVLRGTIRTLEGLAVKLESQPATQTTPILEKLQLWWRGILEKVRLIIPRNLSLKLSDRGLTAIIFSIVAIALITPVILSQAPRVATIPPIAPEPVIPATPIEPEPVIPEPEISEPVIPATPIEPEPVLLEPAPTVELTPEQNLIAAIEKQIAEISDRYGDGLIQSVVVNFPANSLTVKVGDDWYTLKEAQQDKLAARMFQRAKELNFIHLKIIDFQETLLARNPVVGKNMVILKRQA